MMAFVRRTLVQTLIIITFTAPYFIGAHAQDLTPEDIENILSNADRTEESSALPPEGWTAGRWRCNLIERLAEASYSAGSVTLNNFQFGEATEFGYPVPRARLAFSAVNRSVDPVHFSLQFIGLRASEPVVALSAQPSFGMIPLRRMTRCARGPWSHRARYRPSINSVFASTGIFRMHEVARIRRRKIATALFGMISTAALALPSSAQASDCIERQQAAWQMQIMRQELAYAYPSGQAPAWYSTANQTQSQAALRELMSGDYTEAIHGHIDQLHLLPLPNGRYLTLISVQDRVCGFDGNLIAEPTRARASITAAENVRAAQQEQKAARFPGSPEFEELYQIGLDAHPAQQPYPSHTCEALAHDPELQLIPELDELEVNGTWRGQTVTYLSNRDDTAKKFLFHIFGPDKNDDYPWMEGLFLRERGLQTDAILIVRENVCGLDGRASFATEQVRQWLSTPPDNQPTFQPGDIIYMTPSEREAFQTLMGALGGTAR
ncbi:hypothetical protein [Mesorhizobium sp. CAU 1741]|uniref:hypothetical protein n=1 Tax=Mesorhizobium sp. CAU 1741 TaxID=3140366 RepID=UPI00325BE1B3